MTHRQKVFGITVHKNCSVQTVYFANQLNFCDVKNVDDDDDDGNDDDDDCGGLCNDVFAKQ